MARIIVIVALIALFATISLRAAEPPLPQALGPGAVSQQTDQNIQQTADIFANNQQKGANIRNSDQQPEAASGAATLLFSSAVFEGDVLFPETELQAVIAPYYDKNLDITTLYKLASVIAAYYRAHDYPVARAYLPEQEVRDGQVRFVIQAGKIGKIKLDNQSLTSENLVSRQTRDLHSGAYITTSSLERAGLLLNDLAGVDGQINLAPGMAENTVDLTITATTDPRRWTAFLSVDNYGGKYTGPYELNGAASCSGLSNYGDTLSISALGTLGQLYNGGVSYSLPLGGPGAKINAAYNYTQYTLGSPFDVMGYTGKSQQANLGWSQPLIRGTRSNLYWQAGYSFAQNTSVIAVVNATDTTMVNSVMLGINGNFYDNWLDGGYNNWGIELGGGSVAMSGAQPVTDYLNLGGSFVVGEGNFAREQYLNSFMNLHVSANGQVCNKNLASSNELLLSGPYAVRAYAAGDYAVDEGILASAELRCNVAPWSSNSWMVIPFLDLGAGLMNQTPYPNQGLNGISLAGAGLGVQWQDTTRTWYARADYAWQLGDLKSPSNPDQNGMFLIKVAKYF
ncbi:MAG: ShlB/FhaC/HecB family hemolysin secretion/activation protein [Bacillota bacterium]